MSFSSFGRLFQITTFGESHGPALGVVVDGVPPRFELDLEAIQAELDRRRPGQGPLTSARREADQVEILSGLLERTTTGAPLCMVIFNRDARPEAYEQLRDIFRPGHADVTYQRKYGIRDWRGARRRPALQLARWPGRCSRLPGYR
jgi:chorismate synthase